jgi:DNA-binding beta-propeller fold protein YncE
MKSLFQFLALYLGAWPALAQLQITSFTSDGTLALNGAFSNGICTVESAVDPAGPWVPATNLFTTGALAQIKVSVTDSNTLYRTLAVDLSNGGDGFSNLVQSYNLLATIAGAGGSPLAINKWLPEFEGGPATNALLSRPHIAMADGAGNIFIADKEAQAIRKITPDGFIFTVAGTGERGDGPDDLTPGTQVELDGPNGLWVRPDGTVYILDQGNNKVRRLTPDGLLSTLFNVPHGVGEGRGLWVKDDESLAFVAATTVVKKWTPDEGVSDYASGFIELGNLTVDPDGYVVVTDRNGHRVWRCFDDGSKITIAGNGTTTTVDEGGGDGGLATLTPLREVRGVWFLPTGAYFVCTHRGSQVWYVDVDGYIHLFLNGSTADTHGGDGTWFWNLEEYRVSECRAITLDGAGNIILCEHDSGYIRKVQFLRHGP